MSGLGKGRKKSKNLARKSEVTCVRLTAREKKRLQSRAKDEGKSLSEYIRIRLAGKLAEEKSSTRVGELIVLCEDIYNHIQEKYVCEDDTILEERMNELWKCLQSKK